MHELPPLIVTDKTDYAILRDTICPDSVKRSPVKERKKMTSENPHMDNANEKIINWLDKNRDAFGRKILCVCLDMKAAAHIAHVFPDASIVVLTKETPAEAQSGLVQPLVIQTDLKDYDGGMFDTVIAVTPRPLSPADKDPDNPATSSHKWIQADIPCPQFNRGAFYLHRASLFMEYFEKTAGILRRNLREGGTLLNLVQSEHDEHLLGYCLSLAAEGMEVSPSVKQILCRKNGERVTLQAIRAAAGGRTDINALIAENLNFSLDRMDTSAEEVEGEKAAVLLQADASELVRGYNIYQEDKLMGKLAVYTSVQRPDVLYYFTDIQGDVPYLRRFHTEDQKKLIRHMVGELHRQKAADKSVSWRELVLNDDWSEHEL